MCHGCATERDTKNPGWPSVSTRCPCAAFLGGRLSAGASAVGYSAAFSSFSSGVKVLRAAGDRNLFVCSQDVLFLS